MKLFLARYKKKLHSLVWVLSEEEAHDLDDPKGNPLASTEEIAKLNAFLSATDPYDFLDAIEAMGAPMLQHVPSVSPTDKKYAERIVRRYSGTEFATPSIRKQYSKGSRRTLANECWFFEPNKTASAEKENSARRAVERFNCDAEEGLEAAIEQAGSGSTVVVEPLLDWLYLKNSLAIFLRLKYVLANPSEDEKDRPLEVAGFQKSELTEFGAITNKTYSGYSAPVVFNAFWKDETLIQKLLSGTKEAFRVDDENWLRWAQYERHGFELVQDGLSRYTRLMTADNNDRGEIRYISEANVRGVSGSVSRYEADWGGNLYYAVVGDGMSQMELAQFAFESFVRNRIENGDVRLNYWREDYPGDLLASSLESRLWLAALGWEGMRVGICAHCGLPFFATENSRKRFCSSACTQAAR